MLRDHSGATRPTSGTSRALANEMSVGCRNVKPGGVIHVRSLIVAAIAAVIASLVPATSANAAEIEPWSLLATSPGCESSLLDEDYCGPRLVVTVPYVTAVVNDDTFSGGRLTVKGPAGPVPLRAEEFLAVQSDVSLSNPGYAGAAVAARVGTGAMAPGLYTVRLDYEIAGRWRCSAYYENGCNWTDDREIQKIWQFRYTGAPAIVPQQASISSLLLLDGKPKKGKPAVAGIVSFQGASAGDRVIVQVRDGKKWETIGRYRIKRDDLLLQMANIYVNAPAGRQRFRAFVKGTPQLVARDTVRVSRA